MVINMIHQHYVHQVMLFMMNDLVMKFLLVLVQVIIINTQQYRTHESMRNKLSSIFCLNTYFSFVYSYVHQMVVLENLNVQSRSMIHYVLLNHLIKIFIINNRLMYAFLEPPPGPEPAPIIIKVIISFIKV